MITIEIVPWVAFINKWFDASICCLEFLHL